VVQVTDEIMEIIARRPVSGREERFACPHTSITPHPPPPLSHADEHFRSGTG
jgi:hypothetical protein